MFFVLPCIDSYQKVDLRVVSFNVPPQEVKVIIVIVENKNDPRKSQAGFFPFIVDTVQQTQEQIRLCTGSYPNFEVDEK